nr:aspartate aminotransferase family protein [Metabacillus mangrovi]
MIKPQIGGKLPEISFGRGVYLYGADGRDYLDGSSGAITCSIGHGIKEVAEAMHTQAKKISFVYRSQFTSAAAEALAAKIAEWLPGDLNHSFFVNSGSEAAETAMKMAIQYWQEKGEPSKTIVLSRWRSYHGITMGALSLSGFPERRERFQYHMSGVPDIAPPYCARCPFGKVYPECGLMCAEDLERSIKRRGRQNIAAFIAEPIVGAAGACLVPPAGYYEKIREICTANEILFIADEVMTGMGRTGNVLGIQHWDCQPDLAVLGKGLGAGYAPIAAVVATDRVMEAFLQGSRSIMSGHTYSANPQSAAASLAVLQYIENNHLILNAEQQGDRLKTMITELDEPFIGDVRGKGLLIGIELVQDRASMKPFLKKQAAGARLIELAFKNGLLLYPASAGVEGGDGDAVIAAPPLTINDRELAEFMKRFTKACSAFRAEQREGVPDGGHE